MSTVRTRSQARKQTIVLPNELLVMIVSHVSLEQCSHMRQLSRYFNHICGARLTKCLMQLIERQLVLSDAVKTSYIGQMAFWALDDSFKTLLGLLKEVYVDNRTHHDSIVQGALLQLVVDGQARIVCGLQATSILDPGANNSNDSKYSIGRPIMHFRLCVRHVILPDAVNPTKENVEAYHRTQRNRRKRCRFEPLKLKR